MSSDNDLLMLTPDEPFEAYLDHVDWTHLRGWARNPAQPDVPVWLEVVIDDAEPVRFLSNMLREDLAQAGLGTGRYGFFLNFSRRLDSSLPHRIRVRRVSDGAALHNSPWLLPAAPSGSPEARARFEAMFSAEIEAARTGEELLPLTRFLVGQTDRLLQAAADHDSGRTARRLFRSRWVETVDGAPQALEAPDPRPLALFVGIDLPQSASALALLAAMQALGMRVGVVAMRGLVTEGPAAEALTGSGITVHGAPFYGSVEDVLRRNTPDFRLVVLQGAIIAAGYAVTTKLHHPRAKVLAWMEDLGQDLATIVAAQLLCDATLAGSEAAVQELQRRVQGRVVHLAPADAETWAAVLRRAAGLL